MSEAPLSTLALYAARPTLRVNGTENDRASGLVTSMDMVEHESGLSTLELRFTKLNPARPAGREADLSPF